MSNQTAEYDVVIVGAGPAGAQCSRELAQAGKKVLLIERFRNFQQNDFSSAGTVLETLRDFDLPDSVIGGHWNRLNFITPTAEYTWHTKTYRGVVFDFAGLRQFLTDEAMKFGAEFKLGCRYVKRWYDNHNVLHVQMEKGGQLSEVTTKVLVDASGPARVAMYQPGEKHPSWSNTPGVEYLVKVTTTKPKRFIDPEALQFFIGSTWAPAGYSWIFPMQKNIYKFGFGASSQLYSETHQQPMTHFIDLLLEEYIGPRGYKILDKHGGIVRGANNRDDKYWQGNIIGVGDTISTIYPIAGEGIRHALHSGRIGAQSILQYLNGEKADFAHYEAAMKKYLSWKWWAGEQFMQYFHRNINSKKGLDPWLRALNKFSLEEIVEILFFYQFQVLLKLPFKFN